MPKRRRGHGEGSIYQRADGHWCCAVDLGIVDGRRKRKVLYGETRKAVADQLRDLHNQQSQGVDIAPKRQTAGQFLAMWLEEVVKVRNRPRTYSNYKARTNLYIIPAVGKHELSKLTPAHVQSLVNQLTAKGLAPSTVRQVRAILSCALNRAVKWGYVPRNVVALTDSPRVERREIVPLSKEQAQRLLEVVKGDRFEALYRVALSLGLRRGEILGLRWQDVDFDAKLIRIRCALQRQNGKLELTSPKSRAGRRVLSLPPVLARYLQEHWQRQQEEKARIPEWVEHDFVFPSYGGTPMEPRNLIRKFKRILQRVGLPDSTRFHDLRHSCATLLIAQGVHPRIIMDILGHSQISVTMDTYGHVLPDAQRDALDTVDSLF